MVEYRLDGHGRLIGRSVGGAKNYWRELKKTQRHNSEAEKKEVDEGKKSWPWETATDLFGRLAWLSASAGYSI